MMTHPKRSWKAVAQLRAPNSVTKGHVVLLQVTVRVCMCELLVCVCVCVYVCVCVCV